MTIRVATDARPRRGLHRVVVDDLGLRIVCGDLCPGTALPSESDLATELAVSRTVVREATKVLAAKGLVESRPKTGTRVLPRSSWNLIDPDILAWQFAAGVEPGFFRDLNEVRTVIEPRAAELAAERATDSERQQLSRLLAAMEAAGDDPRAYIDWDLRFHGAVLRATHNELLARMADALLYALRAGRQVTSRTPSSPPLASRAHRAVVEAIERGDAAAARTAMETVVRATSTDGDRVITGGSASGPRA